MFPYCLCVLFAGFLGGLVVFFFSKLQHLDLS